MARLLLNATPTATTPLTSSSSPISSTTSSSSTLSFTLVNHSLTRLYKESIGLQSNLLIAHFLNSPASSKKGRTLVTRALADVDGTNEDGPESPSESDEGNIPVQDLPLESKLQLKLEQKMRMKLAKKIRLRRKKLVRKRRLRKKGRWPPSKLKKNKNV